MKKEVPLKIVKLEAENVKRLVAVEITPEGSVVVVGGKNGAGKTSVLDSIAYALGGQSLVCERPLRDGAESGHVEVDLGDLIVRREFTPSGTSRLTVSNHDGARFPSPQTMLDKLVGRLSFDPLEFTRMEQKKQLETLRALVGIDFTMLDAKRLGLYEERAEINRTVKSLEGALAQTPRHTDAPVEKVSVIALMAELGDGQAEHRAADSMDRAVHDLLGEAEGLAAREQEIASEIRELEQRLRDLQSKARALGAERGSLLHRIETDREGAARRRFALPDLAPIRAKIAGAEAENLKLRENAQHDETLGTIETYRADSKRLTSEIDAIDTEKAAALSAAKFPVEGLSFDAEHVLFGGMPFDQASGAEQIRVSMAMAFAMNPRLRVALIRDASLLDEDSLALVAQMAEEAQAQVWLEVVRTDESCSVVIEDGSVRELAPRFEPDAPRHPLATDVF